VRCCCCNLSWISCWYYIIFCIHFYSFIFLLLVQKNFEL
jgi:hypothetical protein